jgi:hypothetical protein
MKCKGLVHGRNFPYPSRQCSKNAKASGFCDNHDKNKKAARYAERWAKDEALRRKAIKREGEQKKLEDAEKAVVKAAVRCWADTPGYKQGELPKAVRKLTQLQAALGQLKKGA